MKNSFDGVTSKGIRLLLASLSLWGLFSFPIGAHDCPFFGDDDVFPILQKYKTLDQGIRGSQDGFTIFIAKAGVNDPVTYRVMEDIFKVADAGKRNKLLVVIGEVPAEATEKVAIGAKKLGNAFDAGKRGDGLALYVVGSAAENKRIRQSFEIVDSFSDQANVKGIKRLIDDIGDDPVRKGALANSLSNPNLFDAADRAKIEITFDAIDKLRSPARSGTLPPGIISEAPKIGNPSPGVVIPAIDNRRLGNSLPSAKGFFYEPVGTLALLDSGDARFAKQNLQSMSVKIEAALNGTVSQIEADALFKHGQEFIGVDFKLGSSVPDVDDLKKISDAVAQQRISKWVFCGDNRTAIENAVRSHFGTIPSYIEFVLGPSF